MDTEWLSVDFCGDLNPIFSSLLNKGGQMTLLYLFLLLWFAAVPTVTQTGLTHIKRHHFIPFACADVLWYFFLPPPPSPPRIKQEPEETFRATHQVLLPGRGSKRASLPPVPLWRGQRQRAVVGPPRPSGAVFKNRPWRPASSVLRWCPSFSSRLPFLSFSWIKTVHNVTSP